LARKHFVNHSSALHARKALSPAAVPLVLPIEPSPATREPDVVFKKYTNNVITYEILGPISTRAIGTRINKFGKEVPEKYVWVDPRNGEQVIRNSNGMLTPLGTRLKSYMMRQKVNKTSIWEAWIDRDFVIVGDGAGQFDNPWGA
jgi:hypothetical protein